MTTAGDRLDLDAIEAAELRIEVIEALAADVEADPAMKAELDPIGSMRLDATLMRRLIVALRARAVPAPREAAPMSQGLQRSLARHALWLKEFTYGSETYLLGDELEKWIGTP